MAEKLGAVRVAPQVLATSARLATLAVPGVAAMHRDLPSDVDRWFRGKGAGDGVRVQVVDDTVSLDLHIIAAKDVNLYDLGRKVQASVSRSIEEMIGMPVLAVNVHIEDVATTAVEQEG